MSLVMDMPSCRCLSIIQVAVLSRPLDTQRRQILEHHQHTAVNRNPERMNIMRRTVRTVSGRRIQQKPTAEDEGGKMDTAEKNRE